MKKIGREVLFIPAKDNNLRNGEGSFIRLRNGAIMFGYTEYFGDYWEDDATARIVAITSYDEGETWQDKKVIIEKFINARELECAILEDKDYYILEVGEIKSANDLLLSTNVRCIGLTVVRYCSTVDSKVLPLS